MPAPYFSLVQYKMVEDSGLHASYTVDLPVDATPGNLLCFAGYIGDQTAGFISLKDEFGVDYTLSTHSPFIDATTTNLMGYKLITSPISSALVTWTTPQAFITIFLAEFSFTSASVFYDKDATQAAIASSGTSMALPSITPAVANSLLFAFCNPEDIVVAPATGVSAGVWIGLDIHPITGIAAEYSLNATGATPVNFTNSASGGIYRAMSMAFNPSPAVPITSAKDTLRGPHRGSRMTPPYNP